MRFVCDWMDQREQLGLLFAASVAGRYSAHIGPGFYAELLLRTPIVGDQLALS